MSISSCPGRSELARYIAEKKYNQARAKLRDITPSLAELILSQKDAFGCTALHLAAICDDPTLYKEMKRVIGKDKLNFDSFADSPSFLRRICRLSKKVLPFPLPKISPTQMHQMWNQMTPHWIDPVKTAEYVEHVNQLALGEAKLKFAGSIATDLIEPNEIITELDGFYCSPGNEVDSRFVVAFAHSEYHGLRLDTIEKSDDVLIGGSGFINAYIESIIHLGRETMVLRALPNVEIQPGELICFDPHHGYFENKPLPEERRPEALKAFLAEHDIEIYFTLLRLVSQNPRAIPPEGIGLLRQWKYVVESNPVTFLKHLLNGIVSYDTAEKLLTHLKRRNTRELYHGLQNFTNCVPAELLQHCINLVKCDPERARQIAPKLVKRRYTMVSFPEALPLFLRTHTAQDYLVRCERVYTKLEEDPLLDLWDSIWTDHREEFLNLVKEGIVYEADAKLLCKNKFGFILVRHLHIEPQLKELRARMKQIFQVATSVPIEPPRTI